MLAGDDRTLEELEVLSIRALNTLKRLNIFTIKDLKATNMTTLSNSRYVGRKTRLEIEDLFNVFMWYIITLVH